jgi:DNA primase
MFKSCEISKKVGSMLDIEDILDRLNIRGAVDHRGEIWCSCPLPFSNHAHGDQKPSFSINTDTGNCFCFVCGGGSLIWLVSAILGIPHNEAKAWIRGVELGDESDEQFSARIREKLKDCDKNHKGLSKNTPQNFLEVDFSEEPGLFSGEDFYHPWLAEQNISEETAKKFKIFYDPKRRGIAFPHYWQGKIVGMQFRNLAYGQGSTLPKYYNTPHFPKKNTLFNYDFVEGDEVIVVESPKTVCVLDSLGYHNVVATFGASVGYEQIAPLRKFRKVYLAPDNDVPGQKALGIEIGLLKDFVDLYIVPPVPAEKGDLADINGSEVPNHLAKALPYLKWRLQNSQ